jgi:hypothetical protein
MERDGFVTADGAGALKGVICVGRGGPRVCLVGLSHQGDGACLVDPQVGCGCKLSLLYPPLSAYLIRGKLM